MTIETELAQLVAHYAEYDLEKKAYKARVDSDSSLLSVNFAKWMNRQLVSSGLKKDKMDEIYAKLFGVFHPSSIDTFSPEVKWLEEQLSDGLNNGACFRTLTSCYDRLNDPAKFKKMEFSRINSMNDYRKWLEESVETAPNDKSRALFTSLINLLDQSCDFFDEAGAIKPQGLKNLVTFIPVAIAGCGTVIVWEELLAVYALYFLLLKGGQKLSGTDYSGLQKIGKTMQSYTAVTALATTTLLVRLLEMIFWASQRCLATTLSVGSSIFTSLSLIPATEEEIEAAVCRDLKLASEDSTPGIKFDTPQLKVIAAPFEQYLAVNAQQFFVDWRAGGKKRLLVNGFLLNLQALDRLSWTVEDKLAEVKIQLDRLKQNKYIYSSKTASAIDYVDTIIRVLQSSSTVELIAKEQDAPALIS